jgi:hypothetical protein
MIAHAHTAYIVVYGGYFNTKAAEAPPSSTYAALFGPLNHPTRCASALTRGNGAVNPPLNCNVFMKYYIQQPYADLHILVDFKSDGKTYGFRSHCSLLKALGGLYDQLHRCNGKP